MKAAQRTASTPSVTGTMKQGDFSKLADDYVNRPGYSHQALLVISSYIKTMHPIQTVADVGAGTGKLTEILAELGFRGFAVEPNDAMREKGVSLNRNSLSFQWRKGTGEETGLADSSVDWLMMASSFHWTDPKLSLKEFHRVLRPGCHLTVLWNPRDIEHSPLQQTIEKKIAEIVPTLNRVSSGSSKYTKGLEQTLVSTGHFRDVFFTEVAHEVKMSPERYLGAWRSVNDIQAQAGPERFEKIMRAIEKEIAGMPEVTVPYKTRAWTVRSQKK